MDFFKRWKTHFTFESRKFGVQWPWRKSCGCAMHCDDTPNSTHAFLRSAITRKREHRFSRTVRKSRANRLPLSLWTRTCSWFGPSARTSWLASILVPRKNSFVERIHLLVIIHSLACGQTESYFWSLRRMLWPNSRQCKIDSVTYARIITSCACSYLQVCMLQPTIQEIFRIFNQSVDWLSPLFACLRYPGGIFMFGMAHKIRKNYHVFSLSRDLQVPLNKQSVCL